MVMTSEMHIEAPLALPHATRVTVDLTETHVRVRLFGVSAGTHPMSVSEVALWTLEQELPRAEAHREQVRELVASHEHDLDTLRKVAELVEDYLLGDEMVEE